MGGVPPPPGNTGRLGVTLCMGAGYDTPEVRATVAASAFGYGEPRRSPDTDLRPVSGRRREGRPSVL
jgi:hypothetical protein